MATFLFKFEHENRAYLKSVYANVPSSIPFILFAFRRVNFYVKCQAVLFMSLPATN